MSLDDNTEKFLPSLLTQYKMHTFNFCLAVPVGFVVQTRWLNLANDRSDGDRNRDLKHRSTLTMQLRYRSMFVLRNIAVLLCNLLHKISSIIKLNNNSKCLKRKNVTQKKAQAGER